MSLKNKKKNLKIISIAIIFLIAISIVNISYSSFSTSGFEGISAQWDKIQFQGKTYHFSDPTHAVIDLSDKVGNPSWLDDWTRYMLETDQPKFKNVISSKDIWFNNSDEAHLQRISIERWILGIDIYALSAGGTYSPPHVKFILKLSINKDTIFRDHIVGAYIIHAYVSEYLQLGTKHELILPTQGAFTLYYNTTYPPTIPENDYVDPEKLSQYTTVYIVFETSDFAPEGFFFSGYTDAHVHYEISLDIVKIGQWTMPLNTELGGENRIGGKTRINFIDYIMNGINSIFGWFEQFGGIILLIVIMILSIPILYFINKLRGLKI